MVVGARRLADVGAKRGADVLVAGTTGMVDGPAGCALKWTKMRH